MITAQAHGILLVSVTLLIVVLVSWMTQKSRLRSDNKEYIAMTGSYFENNDFPSAIINRRLEVCFASKHFRNKNFLVADSKLFMDLFSVFPFSDCPDLRDFLLAFNKHGQLPEQPLFFSLKNDKYVSKKSFSGSYFMIRSIFNEGENRLEYLCVSLIPAECTRIILESLTQQIEQNESHLKRLEELDRLKSEFLATLSHELKTPLVSIKGYLDLMATQKMGPLTEKQEKALRVSLKNTSHLNNLISSILNFARMEAGKLKFDRVNQKIAPHINDIIDSLRPLAENQKISLTSEVEASLPAVTIDADLIHRVLSNLIENSIKFSAPEGVVLVRATQVENGQIKVEVIDHGCGISPDKLDFIKAPFFQADKSDTRPTGGLGLGLAIAEKILIGHGTTLTIESVEGKGTNCSFLLKAVQPA